MMAQLVKNPPAMEETWVQSLGLSKHSTAQAILEEETETEIKQVENRCVCVCVVFCIELNVF